MSKCYSLTLKVHKVKTLSGIAYFRNDNIVLSLWMHSFVCHFDAEVSEGGLKYKNMHVQGYFRREYE